MVKWISKSGKIHVQHSFISEVKIISILEMELNGDFASFRIIFGLVLLLLYFLIKIDIDGFSHIISDINMASLAPVVFTRSFLDKKQRNVSSSSPIITRPKLTYI